MPRWKILDEQAVKEFISKLKECGRRSVPPKEGSTSTLQKLGLIEKNTPTRAAILLLGKNPQRIYTTAYIKAGRFKSPTMIVDDKVFDGTLFQQLDASMSWFRDRLETRVLIGSEKLPGLPSGSLAQRQDVWEYPLKALREAIANTICHRIYASNATTMIRLYDDHLTISNPGHLAYQLHAEDLLREHGSYPTNKLIAESFYNVGIIEHWGTGTLLIANALKAQQQPPPEFDVSSPHTFKVKFVAAEQREEPVSRKSDLNARQMQAIEYLGSHAQITSAEFQELFGASKATATRDLSNLARKGILVQMGKGSGIAYKLANRTTPTI